MIGHAHRPVSEQRLGRIKAEGTASLRTDMCWQRLHTDMIPDMLLSLATELRLL